MQETLKLIILTNHLYLLGKVTELDEEPNFLIEECYKVESEDELSKYPLYTEQRYLFLTSDVVLSIVDPSPKVADLHSKTTG